MTNFYTNVTQWGNSLLVREVVNGERVKTRVKYKPTLYAATQEVTPFKTLKGAYVTPKEFNSIKQAKEWIERPENRAKKIKISKEYNQKPENKAKAKEYYATPERKAHRRKLYHRKVDIQYFINQGLVL